MKCPNCNNKIQNFDKFCGLCGCILPKISYPPVNTRRYTKKNELLKIVIGFSILFIITGALIAGGLWSQPTMRAMYAFNKNNLSLAKEIYKNDIIYNKEERDKLNSLLNDKLSASIDDYNKNKKDYIEVELVVNRINKIGDIDISENVEKLERIKVSKAASNKAKELLDNQQYDDGIEEYKKVIQEDYDYKNTQLLIRETYEIYKTSVLDKVDDKILKDDYAAAVDVLDNALVSNTLKEDYELQSKRDEVFDLYRTNSTKVVSDLVNSGEYEEAYDVTIELLEGEFPDDTEILKLQQSICESITNNALDEVNKMLEDDKYSDALEHLEQNLKFDFLEILSSKEAEIKESYKDIRFKELKNMVTISYNSKEKEYTIVPKGYSTFYLNLDSGINIEPRIVCSGGGAVFTLIIGFEKDKWMFMNEITIIADDYEVSFDVKVTDKRTQVLGNGDIAEWYIVFHLPVVDFVEDNFMNLDELNNAIVNSDKATIRFSGKNSHDHTITKSEKKTIKDLWELFNLLDEDPSLIDSLK